MSDFIATIGDKKVSFAFTVGRKILGKQNGYDLGDIQGGLLERVFVDPEEMARVVWAHFGDRLKDVQVETEAALFDLMDGPAVKSMYDAFKAACVDFFPWGPMAIEKLKEAEQATMSPSLASGHLSGNTQES